MLLTLCWCQIELLYEKILTSGRNQTRKHIQHSLSNLWTPQICWMEILPFIALLGDLRGDLSIGNDLKKGFRLRFVSSWMLICLYLHKTADSFKTISRRKCEALGSFYVQVSVICVFVMSSLMIHICKALAFLKFIQTYQVHYQRCLWFKLWD